MSKKWVVHGWYGPVEEPEDGVRIDEDLIVNPGRKYILVLRKRGDGKWYWTQLQKA